ncbi:hypothetical protein FJZ53_00155 [Candidatus Woesearchaeota archaeon]|nr:hypothetical protein [Candidatus Woesearchaeota archaeon]
MISLTYKENVEAYIGNNLGILEDSLDKAAQKHLKLKAKKKSLDFGQALTPENLYQTSLKSISKTRGFLEINKTIDIHMSMFSSLEQFKRSLRVAAGTFAISGLIQSIGGLTFRGLMISGMLGVWFGAGTFVFAMQDYATSSYNPDDDHIRIGAQNTVNAAGAVAHEYTHCLQHNFTSIDVTTRNPIVEGHARGLEGIVSERFAQESNNEAYVFVHSQRVAQELKDAYLYACGKKNVTPKKSLEKLPIRNVRGWLSSYAGHHYSIGVAAMTLASAKYGDNVYKDVMKNDFNFLKT